MVQYNPLHYLPSSEELPDADDVAVDNLAVRRGNCVLMDFNYDGSHNREQRYGTVMAKRVSSLAEFSGNP
jgi:hypothetical protein